MDTTVRVKSERELVMAYREALSSSLPQSRQYDFFPSEEELMQYYKMATQGMVYRCLNLNRILAGVSKDASRLQLHSLVTKTTLAIIDHGLHVALHVGRVDAKAPIAQEAEHTHTAQCEHGCSHSHNHDHSR